MVNIKKILHDKKVLAMYIRSQDWEPGLNFVGKNEDFIQVGMWHYESGKKLGPHKHVKNERKTNFTQETIFIKRGSLRAFVYSENDELVDSVDLMPGDLMVFLSGGHGFEILEDGTQVFEAKNGPYTGLEDRVPFKNS